MMLFEFSINLEDELNKLIGKHKIIIPKAIADELKLLSEKGQGKKKNLAKASLQLIKKFEIIESEGKTADDAVLHLAQQLNGIVLTNDRELRKRIKKSSLHTIYLRGKGKLVLE
jgi:rRNA-processing protein FCF1